MRFNVKRAVPHSPVNVFFTGRPWSLVYCHPTATGRWTFTSGVRGSKILYDGALDARYVWEIHRVKTCSERPPAVIYRHVWAFVWPRRLNKVPSLSLRRELSGSAETASAVRIRQLRPKREGRPTGAIQATDCQTAGLLGRFRFVGALRVIEQLRVVDSGSFPGSPHRGEDLPLGVQSSMRLVSCAPNRGPVRGLHSAFVLTTERLFDRPVAERLKFAVTRWIQFLSSDLLPAT